MHGDIVQAEIVPYTFAGHHAQTEVRIGHTRPAGPCLGDGLPTGIERRQVHFGPNRRTVDPPLQACRCGVADGAHTITQRVGLLGTNGNALAVHVPQSRWPARVHHHEIAVARAEELPVIGVRVGTDPIVAITGQRGARSEVGTEARIACAEIAVREKLRAGVAGLTPINATRVNGDGLVDGAVAPEVIGESGRRGERDGLPLADGGIVAQVDGTGLSLNELSK